MSEYQNSDTSRAVQDENDTNRNSLNPQESDNSGDYDRSQYGRQGYSSAEHKRGQAVSQDTSVTDHNNTAQHAPDRSNNEEYAQHNLKGQENYRTDFDQNDSARQDKYPGSSHTADRPYKQEPYQGDWGQSPSGHYTDPAIATDPPTKGSEPAQS